LNEASVELVLASGMDVTQRRPRLVAALEQNAKARALLLEMLSEREDEENPVG